MYMQSYSWLKFRSYVCFHLGTPQFSRKLISVHVLKHSWKDHKTIFLMQKIDWQSDIWAIRKREFSMGREFYMIPARRETPKAWESPESREFPGNSCTGNSRQGKVWSHTGRREREFPIEHPCNVVGDLICTHFRGASCNPRAQWCRASSLVTVGHYSKQR